MFRLWVNFSSFSFHWKLLKTTN
jgi:hypothetical protein